MSEGAVNEVSRGQVSAGRVAVTGASGFVGSHCCRVLAENGWEVIGFGRRPTAGEHAGAVDYRRWDLTAGPLTDPPAVAAVVHCAATVDDATPLRDQLPATVLGTAHVLTSWPGVRLVHVSSASVYPPWSTGTLTEDDGPGTRFLSPYARAKAIAERVVTAETARSGRSALILRPHAVYGPGDPTLLPRILDAVRGPGRGLLAVPTRPGGRIHLTHVDTLAAAVRAGCERAEVTGPVNVADAEPVDLGAALRQALTVARAGPPRIVRVPPGLAAAVARPLESSARLTGRRPRLTRYLVDHLGYETVYDLSRLRGDLGIDPPPTDLADALSLVAADVNGNR